MIQYGMDSSWRSRGWDGDSGKKSDNAARFTLKSTFRAALANEAMAHRQASSIDDARSALGCPSSMCIRGLMGPCHSATYGAYYSVSTVHDRTGVRRHARGPLSIYGRLALGKSAIMVMVWMDLFRATQGVFRCWQAGRLVTNSPLLLIVTNCYHRPG